MYIRLRAIFARKHFRPEGNLRSTLWDIMVNFGLYAKNVVKVDQIIIILEDNDNIYTYLLIFMI